MATTAQSIMDNAETILQDTSNTRWAEAELLIWLNLGQRAIVREKPDANPNVQISSLSSGLWQSLPSGAVQLLDVVCNVAIDGTTRSTAITMIDRDQLETSVPSWTTTTASTTIKHVIYDPKRTPKQYIVYPQSTGTNYIEIITADLPSNVSDKSNNIDLGDEYVEILLDYVLFRAYSKDSQEQNSVQRALAHYQNFLTMLGKFEAYESMFAPGRRDMFDGNQS